VTITAFQSPVPGAWPFGKITVLNAGTPVAINVNIGTQTANATTHPTPAVKQLIFFAGPENTDLVYILRNTAGASRLTTNFVVAIVAPGQTVPLPNGSLGITSFNPDDYVVDADANGNWVLVTGITG
jgi:hypothetical protein